MRPSTRFAAIALLLLVNAGPAPADDPAPLAGVRRVIFLGDSITYSGQYVEFIEAYLRVHSPTLRTEFLDLGLPSETVSGLSEPGHAGGKFPRPDLNERLDRVLAKTRPDLVVACYGMNDGIYHPQSTDRFARYQNGVRSLRNRAGAVGARVLHVTPPVFDPMPIKAKTLPAGLAEYRQPFEGYGEVLAHYSDWLLSQRSAGWDVIDVHGPMQQFLAQERARDPSFRLANDGVHVNATGHWLIARQILLHWGLPAPELAGTTSGEQVLSARPHSLDVLKLVQQKQRLLKDAWLSATGHQRPGMKVGVPLEQAEQRAGELDAEIGKLIAPVPR